MRVLTVVAEMGSGGAEAVVQELSAGLVGRGHEVVVASAGGRREAAVHAAGARTEFVPVAGRSVPGLLRTVRSLHGVGRRERPDVVHAHNVGATLAAHLAVRHGRRRPPLVTTFHGVAAADYAAAARLLDRCSDRVVAVDESIAERLRQAGLRRAPLSVVRNAVRRPPVHDRGAVRHGLGIADDVPVALCAARLVPQKRHDVLIEAWDGLPGAPVLLLAGDGELRTSLEPDVHRRGLQDRVRFLGERDDVPALLAAADVVVLSSDWEGLPIVLLEALAAGVPVVATDVDGVAGAVGPDAARLVPPARPDLLRATLVEVLTSSRLRASMGRAGMSRAAERFSADAMVTAYIDTYRDAAARTVAT